MTLSDSSPAYDSAVRPRNLVFHSKFQSEKMSLTNLVDFPDTVFNSHHGNQNATETAIRRHFENYGKVIKEIVLETYYNVSGNRGRELKVEHILVPLRSAWKNRLILQRSTAPIAVMRPSQSHRLTDQHFKSETPLPMNTEPHSEETLAPTTASTSLITETTPVETSTTSTTTAEITTTTTTLPTTTPTTTSKTTPPPTTTTTTTVVTTAEPTSTTSTTLEPSTISSLEGSNNSTELKETIENVTQSIAFVENMTSELAIEGENDDVEKLIDDGGSTIEVSEVIDVEEELNFGSGLVASFIETQSSTTEAPTTTTTSTEPTTTKISTTTTTTRTTSEKISTTTQAKATTTVKTSTSTRKPKKFELKGIGNVPVPVAIGWALKQAGKDEVKLQHIHRYELVPSPFLFQHPLRPNLPVLLRRMQHPFPLRLKKRRQKRFAAHIRGRCSSGVRDAACLLLSQYNSGSVFFLPWSWRSLSSNETVAAVGSPLETIVNLCLGYKMPPFQCPRVSALMKLSRLSSSFVSRHREPLYVSFTFFLLLQILREIFIFCFRLLLYWVTKSVQKATTKRVQSRSAMV